MLRYIRKVETTKTTYEVAFSAKPPGSSYFEKDLGDKSSVSGGEPLKIDVIEDWRPMTSAEEAFFIYARDNDD